MRADERNEAARKVIGHGAGILGAAAGGVLGAAAGDPSSAAAFGAAGYLVGQVLDQIGGEISRRFLSAGEVRKVESARTFAKLAIEAKLAHGEVPRTDGFFSATVDNRAAAEELFEGVLLKCKDAHEEKKLRFIANIFANAAFLDVTAAEANAVLSIAERLTYHQMCVLAAFCGVGEFRQTMRYSDIIFLNERLRQKRMFWLADDVIQLSETYRLVGGANRLAALPPEDHVYVGPTPIGGRCFQLMGLGDLPPEDLASIDLQVKEASSREESSEATPG